MSPSELQRQMDSWSCGLFVILAMTLVAADQSPASAVNELIKDVRHDALKLLLNETRYDFVS